MNEEISNKMNKIENEIDDLNTILSKEIQSEYKKNATNISIKQLQSKIFLDKSYLCLKVFHELIDQINYLKNESDEERRKYYLDQSPIIEPNIDLDVDFDFSDYK